MRVLDVIRVSSNFVEYRNQESEIRRVSLIYFSVNNQSFHTMDIPSIYFLIQSLLEESKDCVVESFPGLEISRQKSEISRFSLNLFLFRIQETEIRIQESFVK